MVLIGEATRGNFWSTQKNALINARNRNQNSDHAPENLLSKTRFRSSLASLVPMPLFHLSFRFRFPLALFPSLFLPLGRRRSVWILFFFPKGWARAEEVTRRLCAPDGLRHGRGQRAKLLSSVVDDLNNDRFRLSSFRLELNAAWWFPSPLTALNAASGLN